MQYRVHQKYDIPILCYNYLHMLHLPILEFDWFVDRCSLVVIMSFHQVVTEESTYMMGEHSTQIA